MGGGRYFIKTRYRDRTVSFQRRKDPVSVGVKNYFPDLSKYSSWQTGSNVCRKLKYCSNYSLNYSNTYIVISWVLIIFLKSLSCFVLNIRFFLSNIKPQPQGFIGTKHINFSFITSRAWTQLLGHFFQPIHYSNLFITTKWLT